MYLKVLMFQQNQDIHVLMLLVSDKLRQMGVQIFADKRAKQKGFVLSFTFTVKVTSSAIQIPKDSKACLSLVVSFYSFIFYIMGCAAHCTVLGLPSGELGFCGNIYPVNFTMDSGEKPFHCQGQVKGFYNKTNICMLWRNIQILFLYPNINEDMNNASHRYLLGAKKKRNAIVVEQVHLSL